MLSLKNYFHYEIIGGIDKKFSWIKVFRRALRMRRYNYLFWFRIAYVLHSQPSRTKKSIAKRINRRLIKRHGTEIMLGATIGEGLIICHYMGIVITGNAIIGKNLTIRQNTTIGTDFKSKEPIIIGDNVDIGANSCIIGSNITIGDNVTIGAMSFVNKNIPNDHTVITKKTMQLIKK